MPYTDIAKRIAFKECAIVDGLNLSDKQGARALIDAWASRREHWNPQNNGTI